MDNLAAIRRQPRSAETRKRIMLAAIKVFGRHGLSGARTRAIAEEAGVNHTLLSYYFESKEQLWRQCAESISRRYAERLETQVRANSGMDGKTRLKVLLRAIVGAAAENPEIHRFMVRYALEESEPGAEGGRDNPATSSSSAVIQEIMALQEEGVLPRNADPLILQSILAGAATQIFVGASRFQQRTGKDTHDPAVLKEYLEALFGCLVHD